MLHVPALCSLLSNCKHPFFPSPLSTQMHFHKHKFLIVTKCQLNADLEQVKLPFEEGILIPKKALREELHYSFNSNISPRAHTQTTHIQPMPELPTTTNSHCNHLLTLHTTVQPMYLGSCLQTLIWMAKHLSWAQVITLKWCIASLQKHTALSPYSYSCPLPEAPSPKPSQRNSTFLNHTNLPIICTHSKSKPSQRAKMKVHTFLASHWILPASGNKWPVKSPNMPPGTQTEVELSNAFCSLKLGQRGATESSKGRRTEIWKGNEQKICWRKCNSG